MNVDRAALGRATLARQMLLERTKIAPLAAIERLVGLQAQLAKPPFVGLWTRIAGFEREQLAKLFHDRKAVRATSLRGTLHVMSAKDFVDLRMALQPMLTAGMTSVLRDRAKGIDPAKLLPVARKLLAKQTLTPDAIRNRLLVQLPDWDIRAMGYAVRMLLPLVQVPTDDAWAFPGAAELTIAETWLGKPFGTGTLHALVRRYLAAFGPASVADAQTWSGVAGLSPVFDELRDELVIAKDGRRELFDLPDAPRPDANTTAPVRFLPDFDNFVLGHADRTRFIDDEHRGRVTTKNLQVRATVLVDGRVAATWKIERKKAAATVVLEPFGPIAKKHRAAIEQEGEALARFVEPDATTFAVR